MTTYTEEEAAGKWCPMARVFDGVNRDQQSPGGLSLERFKTHCIGSACMWWRWLYDPASTDAGMTWRDENYPSWAGGRFQDNSSAGAELLPRRGYCGASRP